MEEKKINSDEIDLLEIFQTLYKQKVIILTITAVFTLVSFIISIVMPKTYVAQAIFEGKYVSISEIQEVIKVYEKAQKLKYKIKIIPLKDSNRGRIEVSGRSQEEAKKNLIHVLNITNTELFNIKEVRENLNLRKEGIKEGITRFFQGYTGSNAILDINNINNITNLFTEEKQIEKWLSDPKIIELRTNVIVSSDPVKPKPLLYTAIGFTTGIFLGMFVALLREAIQRRKLDQVT